MTAPNQLNLWMAATTAERDGLGSAAGVSPGDFCLVEGSNLYVAATVQAAASTWEPMAGTPTWGPLAVGGRNEDNTLNRTVFAMTAAPYRAVLDQVPSSITISALAAFNWPTANLTIVNFSVLGLFLFGSSDSVAPGTTAWWRGSYTLAY